MRPIFKDLKEMPPEDLAGVLLAVIEDLQFNARGITPDEFAAIEAAAESCGVRAFNLDADDGH